jgi:hypothetical protein
MMSGDTLLFPNPPGIAEKFSKYMKLDEGVRVVLSLD